MEENSKLWLVIAVCAGVSATFILIAFLLSKWDERSKIKRRAKQDADFAALPKKFMRDYGFYVVYLGADNEWSYRYFITDIFKQANRKKHIYNLHNAHDQWTLGMLFNTIVEKSLLDCKIDYLMMTLHQDQVDNVYHQKIVLYTKPHPSFEDGV